MRILVTGASGFIGSRLVKNLTESGHCVTALVNKNEISVPNIVVTRGDISTNALMLDGDFDIVYHLAAVTPLEKNKDIQKAVNFDGTKNLFEAIRGRCGHVVYASGLGVFGDASDCIIDESTAKNPDTEFARIRLDAEKHLEESCTASSVGFTAVYLGEVYGNGGWFATQLLVRMRNGRFRIPMAGDYFRSFVHVDDAVGALAAVGQRRACGDYIVTDSHPVLFRDFVNFLADEIGARRPGGIPKLLARAALGGDAVKLLTTSTRASNKKISGLIEFKFPTYREGLSSVLAETNQM